MYEAPSYCLDYDFELDKVATWILRGGFSKVLIQLPPALQRCHALVVEELQFRLKRVEVYVSGNPSYGACLVDEFSAKVIGANAIVHFGHVEYPFYKPSIPTLFIPLEWLGADEAWLEEAIASSCSDGECCVVTTAQHIRLVERVCRRVGSKFCGVILGCFLPPEARSCKRVVVVAGGWFHCTSAALHLGLDRDVVCIDPYEKRLSSPKPVIDKLIKVRLWKVSQCVDAKSWLVVNGVLGQNRMEIVQRIIGLARERGVRVRIAIAYRVGVDVIRDLDPCEYDCVVVASCPRIAIDDASSYEKPVLTPGEAIMALSRHVDRYAYPW